MLDDAFFSKMESVLAQHNTCIHHKLKMVNIMLRECGEQFFVYVDDGNAEKIVFMHRLSAAADALRGKREDVLTLRGLKHVSAKMTLSIEDLLQTYQFQQEAINEKMEERRHGSVESFEENWNEIQMYLVRQLELAEFLAIKAGNKNEKQWSNNE